MEAGNGDVEKMKQRLEEVNAEYLSRSQSYDQHYENYTRCLQEIQLKKQALDAFDEAVIMFDEQCRLHEKFQREAQRHEMDGRLWRTTISSSRAWPHYSSRGWSYTPINRIRPPNVEP